MDLFRTNVKLTFDFGSLLKISELFLDRRCQSDLSNSRWTQLRDDPAGRIQSGIDQRENSLQHSGRRSLFLRNVLQEPGNIDLDRRQQLSKVIVQLPGDPSALLF